jgi:hypothetical protein
MRIFVTRAEAPTDPETLWRELLKRGGASSTTPDSVKALNAHVKFDRPLEPGTVLLIPEATDLKANAGTPLRVDNIDEIRAETEAGFKATTSRVRGGFERIEADHAAVAAALKTAAAKRVIDSDPELKKQLQAAESRFKEEKKHAAEAESLLEEVRKLAMAEFAQLRKRLGD